MRFRFGWLAVALALAAIASPASGDEHEIACRLDAFDRAERARYDKLVGELEKNVREVRELPDGYAFRLPPDAKLLARVGEWITYERRCCPFFDFELRWSSGEAAPWLRLGGSPEVKTFLAESPLVRR